MHVVKRKGHKEKFDERKVYASAYAACVLTESMRTKRCETVANNVSKEVKKLIIKKKCVNTEEISGRVAKILKKYSNDAAFMYETHRDIS